MKYYCDTSFFVQQLVPGIFHDRALDTASELADQFGPVPLSELTRFEVLQALRFEAWRNKHNRNTGLPASLLDAALNTFLASIGVSCRIVEAHWSAVFIRAEELTRQTSESGCRTLDVLHVACALEGACRRFYSFDEDQNELARSQGLETPLLGLAQ
jgi:predicted nucleic acid-binding protein